MKKTNDTTKTRASRRAAPRCSAEFQPERANEPGPRFFCQCNRGHPGPHAVMACNARTKKQQILVQWPNAPAEARCKASPPDGCSAVHPQCIGCAHDKRDARQLDNLPCVSCSRSFTDRFEPNNSRSLGA
jgi:hypothetical protein